VRVRLRRLEPAGPGRARPVILAEARLDPADGTVRLQR
jgi:hypothetical protein